MKHIDENQYQTDEAIHIQNVRDEISRNSGSFKEPNLLVGAKIKSYRYGQS